MTVALTNIKEANVLGESIVANQNNKSSNLLSASEINIAELVKRINPVEKDFLKYFPDEMLNEEQVKAKITAIDKNKEKIANIKPKSEESADTFVEVDSEVLKNVYNKYNDPSRWEAERVGDANKKPMSMTNIIAKVRHDFGLNITNGYVRAKNVNGFFDPKNKNIRTKYINNLPTTAHELGHALSDRYMAMTIQTELLTHLMQERYNILVLQQIKKQS